MLAKKQGKYEVIQAVYNAQRPKDQYTDSTLLWLHILNSEVL